MITAALLMFAMLRCTQACQPTPPGPDGPLGPWDLTSAPVFHFTYSPPLAWTYSTKEPVTVGQSRTAEEAFGHIKNSVEQLIVKAIQDQSVIGNVSPQFNTDFSTPVEVKISAKAGDKLAPGEGREQLGAVVSECIAANATATECEEKPLILVNQVVLKDAPLLNGQQWHNVANRLFVLLQSQEHVYLRDSVNVTK